MNSIPQRGLCINQLGFAYSGRTSKRAFEIRNATFECPVGEVSCLAGPSGSGKTTILNLISGELKADSGTIEFGGRRLDHLQFGLRSTATVHQDYALLPDLSVWENITLAVTISAGHVSAKVRDEIEKIINALGIAHLKDRFVSEISGGEAQRVAISRALAVRPDILLLDEPTASLDMLAVDALSSYVQRLKQMASESVILIVSHDRDFCLKAADRLIVIGNGAVAWEGSASDVLSASSRTVYDILGLAFVLDGVLSGSEVIIPPVSSEFQNVSFPRAMVEGQPSSPNDATIVLPRRSISLCARTANEPALPAAIRVPGRIVRTRLGTSGHVEYDVLLSCGILWNGLLDTGAHNGREKRLTQEVWIVSTEARFLNAAQKA